MKSRFELRLRAPALSLLRACGLLILAASTVLATNPKRTALVIGNQRYEPEVGSLRNSSNDARTVARALRSLGFEVIERHDLDRDKLLHALDDFRKTLPGAQVGLFYYAGHGISIGGANYLVPLRSGFDPGSADAITLRMLAETHLFNAEQAVADMSSAGAPCNIVVLDACRTTKLPGASRTRGAFEEGGFVEMTPPAGTLIAFAADSGQAAFDGDGPNGLYTEELLKHLATPGLTIEQVFKRTREGVLRRSDGAQLPAEYSRLIGDDIYLAGDEQVARAIAVSPTPTATPRARSEEELEDVVSTTAAEDNSVECIAALRELAARRGPGNYAAKPLFDLLENAKTELANATVPSTRVIAASETCERVLSAIPVCLPKNHPQAAAFCAKALNRRGDALLILGRPEEALKCYDRAQKFDSRDAYILYNRGRAHLALGDPAAAREDFTAATKLDQPKARSLALEALSNLDNSAAR